MKPELNQTQVIYPPEGPKPNVCVTTAITSSNCICLSFLSPFIANECLAINESPEVEKTGVGCLESTFLSVIASSRASY